MTTYLCAHHLCSIEQNETRALHAWSQLMHRGVKAYIACRIEAAEIYFCAALDVVEVRAAQAGNAIFGEMQWRKPAEFLLNLWLALGEHSKILHLTERLAALPSLTSNDAFLQFKTQAIKQCNAEQTPQLIAYWQPENNTQAVH